MARRRPKLCEDCPYYSAKSYNYTRPCIDRKKFPSNHSGFCAAKNTSEAVQFSRSLQHVCILTAVCICMLVLLSAAAVHAQAEWSVDDAWTVSSNWTYDSPASSSPIPIISTNILTSIQTLATLLIIVGVLAGIGMMASIDQERPKTEDDDKPKLVIGFVVSIAVLVLIYLWFVSIGV